MNEFSNKVVIVTGGGKGVGLGITRCFLAQRATVIVCSRSELEELPEVNGNRAHFVSADVRDVEQINSVIDYAKNTFGRVDVLVNNAGTTHFIPHTDLDAVTDAIWDEIFQVNLKGAFYACRA
ncbi:MAG TPA: SDR family oxidoreductase, partial [Pseudomonadales bacterium]|nr:SDR family oxidoreductase [Pseudomonadales bacterium]